MYGSCRWYAYVPTLSLTLKELMNLKLSFLFSCHVLKLWPESYTISLILNT